MNLKNLLGTIEGWGSSLPWPHQINHCIIASAIAAPFWLAGHPIAGAAAGAAFYIGREIQQWQAEGQTGTMTLLDAGAPTLWLVLLLVAQTWA